MFPFWGRDSLCNLGKAVASRHYTTLDLNTHIEAWTRWQPLSPRWDFPELLTGPSRHPLICSAFSPLSPRDLVIAPKPRGEPALPRSQGSAKNASASWEKTSAMKPCIPNSRSSSRSTCGVIIANATFAPSYSNNSAQRRRAIFASGVPSSWIWWLRVSSRYRVSMAL
jgi:hypothetical protein